MKLLKISCFAISMFAVVVILSGCAKMPQERIEAPAFSPDGQFIIFSYLRMNGNEHIYRIRSDGTNLTELTTSYSRRDFDPIYSPNGSKIVFASIQKEQTQGANLSIMNADGTDIRPLTTGPDGDMSPVFSPDGKRIYFLRAKWFGHYSPIVRSRWHEYDIYSINTDGSDLKQLTNMNKYEISSLSMSPDDNIILIQMSESNADSLWLIPIDNPKEMKPIRPNIDQYLSNKTEKPRAKEPMTYDSFYNPQFSPDGRSILFTWAGYYQGYFGHELYIMDTETKKARKLTDLRSFIDRPSFSLDGKRIIFINVRNVASQNEKYELWQINTDGTNLHRIELDK